MVFVAMRQQHGADALAIGADVTEVGNDNVNAQQLCVGKHNAAIDDDDVIIKFIRHHVHPEFAQAAERNSLKLMT